MLTLPSQRVSLKTASLRQESLGRQGIFTGDINDVFAFGFILGIGRDVLAGEGGLPLDSFKATSPLDVFALAL